MNKESEHAPRRHCMVVLAYYPGAETRVQREAEALVDRGHQVDVICVRGAKEPPHQSHHGVQVHRLQPLSVRFRATGLGGDLLGYLQFLFVAFLELTRLHRRHRYDVVQVHNLPDFLVFCALIPKLQRVPIILDLHDLAPEFYAARNGPERSPSLLARLVLWQESLSCHFADHVITVSDHWRQALNRRGIRPEKCTVVMNVADQRIFQSRGVKGRSSTRDGFQLIYHGTVVRRYGLDLAVQAIDLARQDIPNLHFTISGAGNYVSELISMVRSLKLEDHVTIHNGLRPLEELPAIIGAADVGIVPYRNDVFTDGIVPTKLMEYVALGLPCVAARTSAIEAYFDSVVELFEPGDAADLARRILALHRSPERLKELSQACQGFQQQYNWAKIGAEYVALVEWLAGRAEPGKE
ncbi:MAG: glycosyltransferase family 4 protein [Chloroflexi bacterium]|nr:glycosyltransferase family 4 protein [Chloroflexota bacterium]